MTFANFVKLNVSLFCIAMALSTPIDAYAAQSAWDNPNANMASGSVKPGYAQLAWLPGNVLPLKLRTGMVTLVNMPRGEKIADVQIGANLFNVDSAIGDTKMLISPLDSTTGGDTNLIVTGQSGNTYIFYLRAEEPNSGEITYSQVDVVLDDGATLPKTLSGTSGTGAGSIFKKSEQKTVNTMGVDGEDYGWIKSMKIDPSEFRFDLDIFVPNPDDYVIAPERVWRDRIFTYIDFGDKVIAMTQRPVVSLLVEGGESPVGFRTDGEDGRLLIVEAVGDMVLRSGQRIVCIKKREKPFLIADTASVMALAEANVAQSMISGQSLNNIAYNANMNAIAAAGANYNTTPEYIGMGGTNAVTGAGYYMPMGYMPNNTPMQSGSSVVNMLPAQRNTAGAYLPQTNIPLITSNQNGVAVELKADSSMRDLNDYWLDLLNRFSGEDGQGLLTPYENMVFFAVDEEGVGDLGATSSAARLYRLRIGPIADIDTAQTLCNKLSVFNGVECKVVRLQ